MDLKQRPGPAAHASPHLTVEERVKLGKEARARAPRSSQAEYGPAANRPDPVSLLERQATTRVPELVPIRYGRMLVSPFTFFRGAALIMASDLATTPQSGLKAQICGDAHLSNFGLFASPERKLMFDVNDFTETLPGPWEWDLKRLAASVVIAARDRDFTDKEARAAALEVGARYRQEIVRLAGAVHSRRLVFPHRRRRSARRARGDGKQDEVKGRQAHGGAHRPDRLQGPYSRQPPGPEQAHHRH
jgi:hypothetical protein